MLANYMARWHVYVTASDRDELFWEAWLLESVTVHTVCGPLVGRYCHAVSYRAAVSHRRLSGPITQPKVRDVTYCRDIELRMKQNCVPNI